MQVKNDEKKSEKKKRMYIVLNNEGGYNLYLMHHTSDVYH